MPAHPLNPTERRRLTTQGMHKAVQTRLDMDLGMTGSVCVYDVCAALNVRVRFMDVNMEGMYQRGNPARIHLSSMRPTPRQAFNCGHELGHHLFGHGSTIDRHYEVGEIDEDRDKPEEVLVNAFSAFLLMPVLGVREAFSKRSIDVRKATQLDIYRVACEFGVGYTTLLNHLAYGLNMLPRARIDELKRHGPKSIRTRLAPDFALASLTIADKQWRARHLDIQVGAFLLLPKDIDVDEGYVRRMPLLTEQTTAFQALKRGRFLATNADGSWSTEVRIAKKDFVGLAEYRHFEELDDDEEN